METIRLATEMQAIRTALLSLLGEEAPSLSVKLGGRMAKKVTGKKAASAASKVLSNPRTSKKSTDSSR